MELNKFYNSLRLNLWNIQELLGKKEIERGKFLLKDVKNAVNIMCAGVISNSSKKFCGFLKRSLFSLQEWIDSNEFNKALNLLTVVRREIGKREIESRKKTN